MHARTIWTCDDAQEHNLLQHVIKNHNTRIMRIDKHSLGGGCVALLSLMHKKMR